MYAMEELTHLTEAFGKVALPARVPRARCIPDRPFEVGVVLFSAAFRREAAADLIEGLAPGVRERARAQLGEVSAQTSIERQARVAAFFGERTDASLRLRSLMFEAGPELQDALYRLLPTYHRNLFPTFPRSARPDPPPMMSAFAQRLLREAVA